MFSVLGPEYPAINSDVAYSAVLGDILGAGLEGEFSGHSLSSLPADPAAGMSRQPLGIFSVNKSRRMEQTSFVAIPDYHQRYLNLIILSLWMIESSRFWYGIKCAPYLIWYIQGFDQ
jgi:hypothetical protein